MTISISNTTPTEVQKFGAEGLTTLAHALAPASVALALAFAACSPTTLASDLPLPVVGLIQEKLPGFDLPPADQDDGRQIGWGDFDANGMDDVAVLLSGSEDWQLVVFRQLEGGSYRADVIEQFPGDDREFKRRFPAEDLELKTVAPGATLEVGGTVVEDAAEHAAGLALQLPAAEKAALLFTWDPDHQLFGTTRLRLAAAENGVACAYDPQSGKPNPLGMRAAITVKEQDGNTTFVYEQFPENLAGPAAATLATRRELVFHQTPIEQARALMREEPGYYRELTGDDDPAGFAPVDAGLACQ